MRRRIQRSSIVACEVGRVQRRLSCARAALHQGEARCYPHGRAEYAARWSGADGSCYLFGLVDTPDMSAPPDRFEQDTIDVLKRISRRPIEPTLESELLADLAFDSLQVLELVGELEDHFGIAVPLNDLSRIRTVSHVVAKVRGLASAEARPV